MMRLSFWVVLKHRHMLFDCVAQLALIATATHLLRAAPVPALPEFLECGVGFSYTGYGL